MVNSEYHRSPTTFVLEYCDRPARVQKGRFLVLGCYCLHFVLRTFLQLADIDFLICPVYRGFIIHNLHKGCLNFIIWIFGLIPTDNSSWEKSSTESLICCGYGKPSFA